MAVKKYTHSTFLGLIALSLVSSSFSLHAATKIVTADEVNWGYLNPARGDKSPGAADLWGDRTKNTATGMLVRFKEGFSSPPHIHNITYRGIVINGEMHNDDPDAKAMWMPVNSYWTQPAGEVHITAANQKANMIYLEIDEGPYLVKPSSEHFDNGERPVNLHRDNLVWLHNTDLISVENEGVKAVYLWGDTQAKYGTMIKLPEGFEGVLESTGSEFRSVVIQGEVSLKAERDNVKSLLPGSYIESDAPSVHHIKNSTGGDVTLYVRTNAPLKIR